MIQENAEQNQESQENTIAGQSPAAATASPVGVVEPDFMVSGVLNNNRIIPPVPEASHDATAEGEITVIVHGPVNPGKKRLTRANPLVYEAKKLLEEFGWIPARFAEPTLPLNLIGIKGPESILVLVLRSRNPVANGAVLREEFPAITDKVAALVPLLHYRIMVWVYSPACGWRYFTAFHGGFAHDFGFPEALGK